MIPFAPDRRWAPTTAAPRISGNAAAPNQPTAPHKYAHSPRSHPPPNPACNTQTDAVARPPPPSPAQSRDPHEPQNPPDNPDAPRIRQSQAAPPPTPAISLVSWREVVSS